MKFSEHLLDKSETIYSQAGIELFNLDILEQDNWFLYNDINNISLDYEIKSILDNTYCNYDI